MREKTQANLRNQGVAIAEVRGALQILAQTNLIGKENIQARIKHWEAKLTDIQNRLTEIEFSEPIITLPSEKKSEKNQF
jgi:DNA-binding transcriptional MerR regulator